MEVEEQFSQLASLIGEPARAKILWNLLDGRAFTATELSLLADVSPQSASMHLNKLTQADLLKVDHQGRHRYYALASREVAYAIEALASLLPHAAQPAGPNGQSTNNLHSTSDSIHSVTGMFLSTNNGHIKFCRSCYDHLAGKIGVAITDKLIHNRFILPEVGLNQSADTKNKKVSPSRQTSPGYQLTPAGLQWFTQLGIDVAELKTQRRTFTRQCLDWSERRPHLAGSLGAALLTTLLKQGWLRKTRNSRALLVTGLGEKQLSESLGLNLS